LHGDENGCEIFFSSLLFSSLLFLIQTPIKLPFAALLFVSNNNYRQGRPQQKHQLTATTALSLAKDDDGDGGDGWYNNYDDFLSKLDFEGGGYKCTS